MSNIGDPRNDRRHDEDCEPRPFCEGCAVKFEDASDAALTDGVNLWCGACKREMEKEVAIEAMIAASPMGAPMTAEEAMQLGIAAIFEGNTLLNGRDPAEDGVVLDEVEEETAPTVIDANPLTTDEARADLQSRKGRAA